MASKYPVKDPCIAIYHYKQGVNYGSNNLNFNSVIGSQFNGTFRCDSSNKKHYEIVNDENWINPLNGIKDKE